MDFVGKVVSTVSGFYKDINPSTLSGAIDVVVIERPDGELFCSPFHVRFGKLKLLRLPQERVVEVRVNGDLVPIQMKVGDAGESFFVIKTENEVPTQLKTSPILSPNVNGTELPESFYLDEQSLSPTVTNNTADEKNQIEIITENHTSITSKEQIITEINTDGQTMVNSYEESTLSSRRAHARSRSLGDVDELMTLDTQTEHITPEPKKKIDPLSDTELEWEESRPDSRNGWSWSWGSLPTKAVENQQSSLQKIDHLPTIVQSPINEPPRDISTLIPMNPPLSPDFRAIDIPIEKDHSPGKEMIFPKLDEDIIDMENDSDEILISLCGFKQIRNLSSQQAKELFNKNLVNFENFKKNPPTLFDPNIVFLINNQYYSWNIAAPIIISKFVYKIDLDATIIQGMLDKQLASETSRYGFSRLGNWWRTSSSSMETSPKKESELQNNKLVSLIEKPELRPISPPPETNQENPSEQYAKSVRLNSQQLKSLNLKKGANSISFTVQGGAVCTAKIFFWDYDVKIVVSDVDGTITKSDVFGHLFTMVGRDWTHSGVANLYSNIRKNGYQILYLTSRAIGQANYTREYIKNVEQGSYQLPDGPIIMSPDRLLRAFAREVIMRRPEEFKIAALRDIKRLFKDRNPFYAGFGNRMTDALSYRAVDIPPSRIFTIDPYGELKMALLQDYSSTYTNMNDIVDHLFPPIEANNNNEFNDWNFWKTNLPTIDIENALASIGDESDESDEFDEEDDGYSSDDDTESYTDTKDFKPISKVKDIDIGAFPKKSKSIKS